MAYEVTKLVNGRPYRYSVRSERDPDTGKTRNRWTYLGRGDAGSRTVAAKPRANAREALLEALERLLDRTDPGEVTAGAVSVEAGLAHGTFYRYFRNRDAAIRALAEKLRAGRAADFGALDAPPAGRPEARAALRSWTDAILRARNQHHGLVRALYAMAADDEEMRTAIRERREHYARQLAEWLRDLTARDIVTLPNSDDAAAALYSMIDGVGRAAIAAGEALEETRLAAAVDLAERAVFGVLT